MKNLKRTQVFTPQWLVSHILDTIGFTNSTVLGKKIFEPSFGDGVFLCEAVKRYINIALQEGKSKNDIADELEKCFYGFELDETLYNQTIEKLNLIVKDKLGISSLQWANLRCEDALLTLLDIDGDILKADFIFGNPPYMTKCSYFKMLEQRQVDYMQDIRTQFDRDKFVSGNANMAEIFFSACFNSLIPDGKLALVLPNSWLKNKSISCLRQHLFDNQYISHIVDFGAIDVFPSVNTYASVAIVDYKKNDVFHYIRPNRADINNAKEQAIEYKSVDGFSIVPNEYRIFKENSSNSLKTIADVKNGLATLADKVFIGSIADEHGGLCQFNNSTIERSILKPTYKASKQNKQQQYILCPYQDIDGRMVLMDEDRLKTKYPNAYQYLLKYKEQLSGRALTEKQKWYEFGRGQGIQDFNKKKIMLSNIVKDKLVWTMLSEPCFVYSGLYIILREEEEQEDNWDLVEGALESFSFVEYLHHVGKNMQGGYKSVTSKQIEQAQLANK